MATHEALHGAPACPGAHSCLSMGMSLKRPLEAADQVAPGPHPERPRAHTPPHPTQTRHVPEDVLDAALEVFMQLVRHPLEIQGSG